MLCDSSDPTHEYTEEVEKVQKPRPRNIGPQGEYQFGIENTEYSIAFASLISGFEHLESIMVKVFATLLGMPTDEPAGYVYRAMRSPSQRHQVMRDLLEKAPENKRRSKIYDEILAEYDAIRLARNNYAHGLWYENVASGGVYLSRPHEFDYSFEQARKEPLDNLKLLGRRIVELSVRVLQEVEGERVQRDARLRRRKRKLGEPTRRIGQD